MLIHHLKIAWRQFLKRKTFSFINIFGLTLGFSSFLLIILYVNHARSFDRFHANHEQVFRINFAFQDNAGNVTKLVNSPPALAPGIRGKFSALEKVSRLRYSRNCLFSNGSINFYEDQGYYADSLFLEILKFELIYGNPLTALDEPNSIVITEDMAMKYFNRPNPVGESLLFNQTTPLKITGILANIPKNSHLDFNFLISFPNYIVPDGYASDLSSWGWLGFLTYVELKPNADPDQFETDLAQLFRDLNPEDESPMAPIVQNISEIYLGSSDMADDLASHIRTGNRFTVKALMIVAFLILLIAGFNFSNLSQALFMNRIRSMAVRSVIGSGVKGVTIQIFTESLILTSLCLLLSLSVIQLIFPGIAQFMNWEFGLRFPDTLRAIPILLLAGIFIGLASGFYPAVRFAKMDIIQSLKGSLKLGKHQTFQFKHILLTLQFAISIGLICATFIMTKQINYLRKSDTGYKSENVVLIKMQSEDLTQFFDRYKDRLVQHASVRHVSRSERVVGEPWPFSIIHKGGEDPELSKRIFFNQIDYDYFPAMDIALKSGRFFSKEYLNDPSQSVVLNQQAVELLGLEDPVGHQVHFFDQDGPRTIVGVVEDFNYTSLHQEIGPAAFILPFIDLNNMYVRFNPDNPRNQISLLESTWQQVAQDMPLDWEFLDSDLASLYLAEEKLGNLIQAFSILAILLACLGLYGMVNFMINNRVKEVGIRKVLGASVSSLYTLFIKTYILQAFLAMVIMIPLIHYLLHGWLQNFAYHIHIHWWIYPLAAVTLIVMIVLTVSFQILKVAWSIPSGLLRQE